MLTVEQLLLHELWYLSAHGILEIWEQRVYICHKQGSSSFSGLNLPYAIQLLALIDTSILEGFIT